MSCVKSTHVGDTEDLALQLPLPRVDNIVFRFE